MPGYDLVRDEARDGFMQEGVDAFPPVKIGNFWAIAPKCVYFTFNKLYSTFQTQQSLTYLATIEEGKYVYTR